ncbi:hypothetical protein MNEG_14740 [Monoraphidium neglectum]|uniref:Uncharacterized protein n=1 Tax=Monoraphidium neglectum TaxID=145388 RepID=A0A0D2KB93_9CHLO|nr:hypothetical protein MNEG_14740 [Monoraphidium neglectum]KIY93223.1 hypothetical protein MNEG_14740 [Monoraphidium neglectum]|eukprot:XP_013892243.1 hypothetical protein MNEG_14740 [Monoraphidium neglectum]
MAGELQNFHNWQPAAQQQTLTQILQQLQQLPTQLQQVEGALLQRIADVDHNAHARVINSQLNGPQQVGSAAVVIMPA